MVDAMCLEAKLRRDFLNEREIHTIYFGGGTPSLLTESHLAQLFEGVHENFDVQEDAEITLEANPDDITRERLDTWRSVGINRLSIGVQTFDEVRLKMLNRAHSAFQATSCIQMAMAAGFTNLTCDLIYAIPPSAMNIWIKDVEQMIDFGIPHLSLYGLTVEERTVFGQRKSKGVFQEVSEEDNADQYQYAIERLSDAGYRHYEVSNFSLPGRESQHNSGYWQQVEYLGIGPSAHSFNGSQRAFAVSSNGKYLQQLAEGKIPIEIEQLSTIDQVNEYAMTRARTQFGIDIQYLDKLSDGRFSEKNRTFLDWLVSKQWMTWDGDQRYTITSAGMFNADEIALKLFLDP